LINVWYGSYLGPRRLLRHRGKTCVFTGRKPCSLGEEKPYELPQSDEKPRFAMSVRSSGPAGLRLRPVPPSLDCLNSLGTTASFSSLSKAGVHYVLARPCRSIAVYLLFLPYLNHPLYAISCWPLLYTPCLPPPKAYRRRKGDLFINYYYTKRRAGRVCVPGYLLCLGPSC